MITGALPAWMQQLTSTFHRVVGTCLFLAIFSQFSAFSFIASNLATSAPFWRLLQLLSAFLLALSKHVHKHFMVQ